MKSTSPEPAVRSQAVGCEAGLAAVGATIRPARLDRPLTAGSIDSRYSDPHLEQLVAAAAQQARATATAQGYAAGWSQGRQAAAEHAREHETQTVERGQSERTAQSAAIAAALAGLQQAARTMQQALAPTWLEIGDAVVDAALALARAVLARELVGVDTPAVECIRVALAGLAEPGEVVVYLHPSDLAAVTALGAQAVPAGVRLAGDPTVPVGGALASSGARQLLAHLPTALAAAEEVLRS